MLGILIENKSIKCIYGKGKRKEKVQRFFDIFDEFTEKMVEYETHLQLIGENRNSYSKIDNDATFMRMKEDHMRNGQLKAAYNVQIAVSWEYIMAIEIYQDRADYETFIPFMNHFNNLYGFYPKRPVADAGYGGFDNYCFCLMNNMGLYQKYQMYAKEKEKKYQKDIFNKNNFKKDESGNYICPNGKSFTLIYEKPSRTKFQGTEQIYECSSCEGCHLKNQCTKAKGNRQIVINEKSNELKRQAKENLDSDEGIRLRVQRSVQVEGTFGVMKEDMDFIRFNRRSMAKARLEITLVAIGINISKYHNKKYRIIQ
jgi:hypothetical protein